MLRRDQLAVLASQGLAFVPGLTPDYIKPEWRQSFQLAQDAQPQLVTTPNAGIPAWLANLLDPEIVRVLFTPIRAAEIYGETKKGDWTTVTAQFPLVEPTGEVTSYGDYNEDGSSGANVNWEPRQSYHWQTISQWGERELDMYGEAKIQYKSEVDGASIFVLNKFRNQTYFFGVANLQNYGALNDPSLSAPIAPTGAWSGLAADAIAEDVRRLFAHLQSQLQGNVKMDDELVLAMSPVLETYLAKTNQYNVNVRDILAKNFPKLKIETAPEFSNVGGAGEYMQMFAPSIDGVKSIYTGFTEKMRAHAVIPAVSSWKQKKSAGTWGAINRRPIAFVAMQGM